MPTLRSLSGHDLIKLLSKLGFAAKRQKGSHVILIKDTGNERLGCTVPLHKELKIGTLKGILKQVRLSEDDIERMLNKRK